VITTLSAIRTVFPDRLIGASLSKNNAAELLSTIRGELVFANALNDTSGCDRGIKELARKSSEMCHYQSCKPPE
jgi:hypothetical protein